MDELDKLQDMFPTVDVEVVAMIFGECDNDVDVTVEKLLEISGQSKHTVQHTMQKSKRSAIDGELLSDSKTSLGKGQKPQANMENGSDWNQVRRHNDRWSRPSSRKHKQGVGSAEGVNSFSPPNSGGSVNFSPGGLEQKKPPLLSGSLNSLQHNPIHKLGTGMDMMGKSGTGMEFMPEPGVGMEFNHGMAYNHQMAYRAWAGHPPPDARSSLLRLMSGDKRPHPLEGPNMPHPPFQGNHVPHPPPMQGLYAPIGQGANMPHLPMQGANGFFHPMMSFQPLYHGNRPPPLHTHQQDHYRYASVDSVFRGGENKREWSVAMEMDGHRMRALHPPPGRSISADIERGWNSNRKKVPDGDKSRPRPLTRLQTHSHSAGELPSLKKQGSAKQLILLRGLPGSGKSTLARNLVGRNGVICSTDDLFMVNGKYVFDPSKLGEYHEQNRMNARDAMIKEKSPIIIDNTNSRAWEMKPYVLLANEFNYSVHIMEPETPWRFKTAELARRNTHMVSRHTLDKLLDRFEHRVSLESILLSEPPPHTLDDSPKDHRHTPSPPFSPQESEKNRKVKEKNSKSVDEKVGSEFIASSDSGNKWTGKKDLLYDKSEKKRGDHQRGEHQKGDHERRDHQRGEHQRGDHERRDHQKGEHQRGEHQRGNHQKEDHQRGEHQRGEHQKGGHQKGEHQKGEHQRGEHQRGEYQRGDHQRKDHQGRDHQRRDHQRGDHERGEFSGYEVMVNRSRSERSHLSDSSATLMKVSSDPLLSHTSWNKEMPYRGEQELYRESAYVSSMKSQPPPRMSMLSTPNFSRPPRFGKDSTVKENEMGYVVSDERGVYSEELGVVSDSRNVGVKKVIHAEGNHISENGTVTKAVAKDAKDNTISAVVMDTVTNSRDIATNSVDVNDRDNKTCSGSSDKGVKGEFPSGDKRVKEELLSSNNKVKEVKSEWPYFDSGSGEERRVKGVVDEDLWDSSEELDLLDEDEEEGNEEVEEERDEEKDSEKEVEASLNQNDSEDEVMEMKPAQTGLTSSFIKSPWTEMEGSSILPGDMYIPPIPSIPTCTLNPSSQQKRSKLGSRFSLVLDQALMEKQHVSYSIEGQADEKKFSLDRQKSLVNQLIAEHKLLCKLAEDEINPKTTDYTSVCNVLESSKVNSFQNYLPNELVNMMFRDRQLVPNLFHSKSLTGMELGFSVLDSQKKNSRLLKIVGTGHRKKLDPGFRNENENKPRENESPAIPPKMWQKTPNLTVKRDENLHRSVKPSALCEEDPSILKVTSSLHETHNDGSGTILWRPGVSHTSKNPLSNISCMSEDSLPSIPHAPEDPLPFISKTMSEEDSQSNISYRLEDTLPDMSHTVKYPLPNNVAMAVFPLAIPSDEPYSGGHGGNIWGTPLVHGYRDSRGMKIVSNDEIYPDSSTMVTKGKVQKPLHANSSLNHNIQEHDDVDVEPANQKEDDAFSRYFEDHSIQNDLFFLAGCFPDLEMTYLQQLLFKNSGNMEDTVSMALLSATMVNPASLLSNHTYYVSGSRVQTSNKSSEDKRSFEENDLLCNHGSNQETLNDEEIARTLQETINDEDENESHDSGVHFCEDENLVLKLTPSMARQLQNIFGSVQPHLPLQGELRETDLEVLLSEKAAKGIYLKWIHTLQAKKADYQVQSQLLLENGKVSRDGGASNDEASDVVLDGIKKRTQKNKRKSYNEAVTITPSGQGIYASGMSDVMTKTTPSSDLVHKDSSHESNNSAQTHNHSSVPLRVLVHQLHQQFPHLRETVVNQTLVDNRFDKESTIEELKKMKDGKNYKTTDDNLSSKTHSPPLHTSSLYPKHQTSSRKLRQDDQMQDQSYQELEDPSYNDIRAEAALHAKLRAESFQKAAHARSKKQYEVAVYYAQQGHMHTAKMKEANERAANHTFSLQNAGLSNQIDLHGLHVNEALEVLKEKLGKVEKGTKLQVITGYGSRCKKEAKIKPAVLNLLKSYGCSYEEINPGLLQVKI